MEADRIIRHYARATSDHTGTLDLLLATVEAGTAQAIDLGYGDSRYFSTLERFLARALATFSDLSTRQQRPFLARFRALGNYAADIGWGFGDSLAEAAQAARRGGI